MRRLKGESGYIAARLPIRLQSRFAPAGFRQGAAFSNLFSGYPQISPNQPRRADLSMVVLIALAIMLIALVTLLIARLVSFLILVFFEVPLFGVVPVVRLVILAVA